MEWSHEASLRLIEEYEKAPMLWDTKHPHYYSKTRKQESWEAVAAKMNTDVDELKKKLNSLLGSFRRERMKHRRQVALGRGMHTGAGGAVSLYWHWAPGQLEYVSKWFAYEKMKFLLDVRENSEDMELSLNPDHLENENDEEMETFLESPESSSLMTTPLEPIISVKNGSCKRARNEEDKFIISSQINDRIAYMNNSSYDLSFDEFDALGKIVATRCRHMQTNQRIVAEKLINDILYYGQLEQLSANTSIHLNENASNCVRSPDDGSFGFKNCDI